MIEAHIQSGKNKALKSFKMIDYMNALYIFLFIIYDSIILLLFLTSFY